MKQINILFFIALLSLTNCNKEDETKDPIVAKGSRRFGLHITYSQSNAQSSNYDAEFNTALQTGMTSVPISFLWTSIETENGWDLLYQMQLIVITLQKV